MGGPLSRFTFSQFQFILKAVDCLSLPPYKGSTLRGGFGHAFKKVVCVNREKICESCLLKGKCVYSYVFETPPSPDTSKMRKYPFAPHPFVITPPLEKQRTYIQNDTLCFELTLIGKAIDFLPYFIYTFDELGRMGIGSGKGKYQLEEVRAILPGKKSEVQGGDKPVLYSGNEKILRSSYKAATVKELISSPLSLDTLRLKFLTPTRLKYDGQLSPTLEFHILIRNLLRRISLLSYFHCSEQLELDFKGIIKKSQQVGIKQTNLSWFDWERYSNRQDTRMNMGGFIGSITFQGNLEEFMPFLLLGEYVHVGKGTSFGLGKYEIVGS